jgi:hypothetical protein
LPPHIGHVTPLGEIRRVGPGDLLSVLHSLEREPPPTVIRGKNGRHEVGFGDALVRVEIYSGEETVEVFRHATWLGAWRGLCPVRAISFRLRLTIHSGRCPPLVW